MWKIQNTSTRWGHRELPSFVQVQSFGDRFVAVQNAYTPILNKILRYKKHPDTKAWIEDTIASGNFSESLTPRVRRAVLLQTHFQLLPHIPFFDSFLVRMLLILFTKVILVATALTQVLPSGDDIIPT